MRKLLVCVAVIVGVAALFVACKKKEEAPTVETAATPETAAVAMVGDAVRGLELFKDVNLGTTGKSCESCHPNGGQEGMKTKDMTTKPLVGVKDRYPGKFPAAPDKGDMTLAQVVNACLTGPLGGQPLAEDSQDMKDILAYLEGL
jgi:cytochrome c